jgi:hypothetical protein
MLECQTLKTKYQTLENLQKEFELELTNAIKSGKTEKAQKLKKEIEQKLSNLKRELLPKKFVAIFVNPETKTEEKKEIDAEKAIAEQSEFYEKHNIKNFDENEVWRIFKKHKKEIQKEMETYGYDNITIIPAKLPTTEELNQKMTGDYAKTWKSESFDGKEGLNMIVHAESQKTKIILTHSDQYIYENDEANPFLKETLEKSFNRLNTEKIHGLSLNEYLIIQRQYYENKKTYLDKIGWTWLPQSCSPYSNSVVIARWDDIRKRLVIRSNDWDESDKDLGCRLCKTFE